MRDGPDDRFDNRLTLVEYIAVPETQHPELLALEIAAASVIVGSTIDMLASIQLYDQLVAQAGEIGDVGTDGDLPAEAGADHFSAAQFLPQELFRVGGAGAEIAREVLR
ncbi:MAG TPA: hypothetical protein VEC14_06180 [Reyranellaceae bacterium]|nr:hypothetical protein [Reyranellaceae bacterium]